MDALVTGANGFIGSHLVDRLLEQGCRVRCLVRRKSDCRWLRDKPVESLLYDRIDESGLADTAVAGVAIVFHVLGTLVAPNRQEFDRINVHPVERMLEACAASSSLQRFLLVGSQGAAGPNPPDIPRLAEHDPCRPVSDYGRSKLAAEEVCRAWGGKLPWTIVRPSAVYGPRDVNLLKIFHYAQKGYLPVIGSEKAVTLAHVRDIVDGILRAATAPQACSQTYFLASEEIYSTNDLRDALAEAIGHGVRPVRIPRALVKGLMAGATLMSWLGKDGLLSRDRLYTLTCPRWVCDVTKARCDLGYQPAISLRDGFRETHQWYRTQGWL